MSFDRKLWSTAEAILLEAKRNLPRDSAEYEFRALPPSWHVLEGTLDECKHFIDVDEYELAWDALAAVAERENAGMRCWNLLADAAKLMGMPEQAEKASKLAAEAESDE